MRLSRENEACGAQEGAGGDREGRVERTRSASVRNEARGEGRSGCGMERRRKKRASERIEITNATERAREKERRRYAERGMWADRTRRVVARAHKLNQRLVVVAVASSSCCLLRSTVASLPPFRPPLAAPCPHLSARYVALCGVRLTNPTSCPSSLRPALSLPLTPRYTATTIPSACTPPVHPPARETARCRTTELPYVPTPPLPGRLQSSPILHPLSLPRRSRPPPSRRSTPLRFARLRFRVSLSLSLCVLSRSFPRHPLAALLASPATASRRPTSSPSGKPAHPKAARCASERATRQPAPRLSLVRSRMSRARVCVRVCAVCGARWDDQG